jgi:hypothetical protein
MPVRRQAAAAPGPQPGRARALKLAAAAATAPARAGSPGRRAAPSPAARLGPSQAASPSRAASRPAPSSPPTPNPPLLHPAGGPRGGQVRRPARAGGAGAAVHAGAAEQRGVAQVWRRLGAPAGAGGRAALGSAWGALHRRCASGRWRRGSRRRWGGGGIMARPQQRRGSWELRVQQAGAAAALQLRPCLMTPCLCRSAPCPARGRWSWASLWRRRWSGRCSRAAWTPKWRLWLQLPRRRPAWTLWVGGARSAGARPPPPGGLQRLVQPPHQAAGHRELASCAVPPTPDPRPPLALLLARRPSIAQAGGGESQGPGTMPRQLSACRLPDRAAGRQLAADHSPARPPHALRAEAVGQNGRACSMPGAFQNAVLAALTSGSYSEGAQLLGCCQPRARLGPPAGGWGAAGEGAVC